jgi:hypothetical protein
MSLVSDFHTACDSTRMGVPYVIPAYTVIRAKGRDFSEKKQFEIRHQGRFVASMSKMVGNSLTTDDVPFIDLDTKVSRLSQVLDTSFNPSSYRQVIDNPDFRTIYSVKRRSFEHMHSNGRIFPHMLESAPCRTCGILLPIDNLQVDHQRPQSGGTTEAIAKVFRACGLTAEGPQGPKGQQFLANAGAARVFTKVNSTPYEGESTEDRYSLNSVGAFIYSFWIKAYQNTDVLAEKCLHNMLNLRLLCSACNTSRGNPLKRAEITA